MFNAKSDYAYNKKNLAAIVYQTAGGPIMLTRSDFDSDEEFQRWKDWSDQNYRETERQNRPSDDHLTLEEYIEAAAVLLNFMDESNQCNTQDQELDLQRFRLAYHYGKRTLTKTQRRRLTLFAHGMTVTEIAHAEGVKKQSVSESLRAAKRKLIKFVKRLSTIDENTLTKP